MSQISLPIRILLAGAVVFLVAWMTVLKPKSDTTTPAPAPATTPAGNLATGKTAVSTPGKLVQKAQDAAKTASKAGAAAAGESTTTGSAAGTATTTAKGTSTTTATAAPALGALAGVPKPVAQAIAKQKVVVLGIFDKQSIDRDVRASLAGINRWNGRVFVKAVPLSQVGRYSRITSGAQVDQAPSVVVVDRALKATLVPGFTDRVSIDQAVVDALRASGGLFTDPYLHKLNAACSRQSVQLLQIPSADNARQVQPTLRRALTNFDGLVADVRAVKAPARWAAYDKRLVSGLVTFRGYARDWSRAMGPHPTVPRIVSTFVTFAHRAAPVAKHVTAQMRHQNLISCLDG